jgi:hypothetical protein
VSTSADATLAAIDGCLRDNSVSGDAMRWSPDPGADELTPAPQWRGATPSLVIYDEVADWQAAGEHLSVFADAFADGMKVVAVAVAKALLPLAGLSRQLAHAQDMQDRPRWHRIRCPQCNPAGNPPPCPGGREYHRRQKARRRRGH